MGNPEEKRLGDIRYSTRQVAEDEDDASTVRELSLGIERASRICKDKRIMQRDVLVDAVLNGAPNRTGTPSRGLMAMPQASCRGPKPRSQALPKLTNRSSKKTLGAL